MEKNKFTLLFLVFSVSLGHADSENINFVELSCEQSSLQIIGFLLMNLILNYPFFSIAVHSLFVGLAALSLRLSLSKLYFMLARLDLRSPNTAVLTILNTNIKKIHSINPRKH